MERRKFLKQAGLTAAGMVAAPYLLPSGRLFAASGARVANHVVFCLFAGGIRNFDSVQKKEGNLMPGLLSGNESLTPDIAASVDPLPALPGASLQQYGTLFREFRYGSGPSGHYNGHTTALTGQYTDNSLSLLERPPSPTIFELYRKHNTPIQSAMNAWWISHTNQLYPILNYSTFDGYGPQYGANQLSPTTLFNSGAGEFLSDPLHLGGSVNEDLELLRKFNNGGFKGGSGLSLNSGIINNSEDQQKIQDFMDDMYTGFYANQHTDPWGVGAQRMNGDMRNVFYAEQVMQTFNPELLVVNMFGVDICHSNFTQYCNNLRKIDWAVNHMWQTIQSTPGMANDTIMIVAPEIGRNATPNSILDANGRGGLDHTTDDDVSRELFCLVVGPSSKVKQGQVINSVEGESIDIAPTIAHILGFHSDIQGQLPGKPLMQAFV